MKVTFEPAASDELNRIFEWTAKDNPRAAAEMITRIEAKVMRLAAPELTHMGRPGWCQVLVSCSNGLTLLSTARTNDGTKL